MLDISRVITIFFDLDGTLIDYDASVSEALLYVYESINGEIPGIEQDKFIETYWKIFNQIELQQKTGKTKNTLEDRIERFERVLYALTRISNYNLAKQMAALYSEGRCQKPVVFENANDLLFQLSKRYGLGIITEGNVQFQRKQLLNAGLTYLFKWIIISEETGYHKPDKKIFAAACKEANVSPDRTIMIGDRLDWDLIPAKSIGMQTIWFKYNSRYSNGNSFAVSSVDVIVKSMQELKLIFNLT